MKKKNQAINVKLSVENGKINGAKEFAEKLCSGKYVQGTAIKFNQKRNNKTVIEVTANSRPAGTISILKGFVFTNNITGEQVTMYGSPDRDFPGHDMILSVMFNDLFGRNTELVRVIDGSLKTTELEIAKRIIDIYREAVEVMTDNGIDYGEWKPVVDYINEHGGGIILVDDCCIEICDGDDPDGNPCGEWHYVKYISIYGVGMDNNDFYQYTDLTRDDIQGIIDYLTI